MGYKKYLDNGARRGLRGVGLRARKGLGQNFLIDEAVKDRIIEAARLSAGDVVVEVGPGTGVLTEKLAEAAGRVVAVELDRGLAARLQKKMAAFAGVEIINADILETDLGRIGGLKAGYKVVANIPYYITSPILRYFTRNRLKPDLMLIMMQEEVARDVTAGLGHMTFLSASMQLFSRPEMLFRVPAASFYPVPRVDSAVVRFNMLQDTAVDVGDTDKFLDFLHSGFSAPRKQMRNSLAVGMKVEAGEAARLLSKAGIDAQRRPGTLALEEWARLYRCAGEGRC